ncbi:MAG: HPr family phosphocarrier protein [Lentisphaerae bacterium]|nr:HPr family phosphocarrier protein [Lentisphaerota bacterium]
MTGTKEDRITCKLKIRNECGLNLQTASVLVKTLWERHKDVKVFLSFNGLCVNAQSMLGVLTLCAGPGDELLVEAEGEGAAEALKTVVGLFSDCIGENEEAQSQVS